MSFTFTNGVSHRYRLEFVVDYRVLCLGVEMIEDCPSLHVLTLIDIHKVQLIDIGEQQKMLRLFVKVLQLLLSELMEFQLFRVQGLAGLALINLLFKWYFGNARVDVNISVQDCFVKRVFDFIVGVHVLSYFSSTSLLFIKETDTLFFREYVVTGLIWEHLIVLHAAILPLLFLRIWHLLARRCGLRVS